MSTLPYAPYGDALKLILVGSTTEPLSPEQRTIFTKMLARRMHTKETKKGAVKTVAKKRIANVRSKKHKDKKTGARETMYCIPDVLLYMAEAFDEWGMMTPPLDLAYLRHITNQLDESEPASMVPRWLELRRDLATLDRNAGSGGPIHGEAPSDLRRRLEGELKEIWEQIKKAKSFSDSVLQDAANALAKKWVKEGKKKFTKREIAGQLAVSDDWNHMIATTIERKIRKQWKNS